MSDIDTSKLILQLLRNLGEDPEREGLQGTPQRVADSLAFLLCGYQQAQRQSSAMQSSMKNAITW